MAQCPNCFSRDIAAPFFGGKPLPGSPEPAWGQILKHQQCRACKKFFEPTVPTPVFATLVALTGGIGVLFIFIGHRLNAAPLFPGVLGLQWLTMPHVLASVFFSAALAAVVRRSASAPRR